MGTTNRKCSIEGCGKTHNTRGLCTTHHKRLRLYGDPLITAVGTRSAFRATDRDRLLAKVDRNGPTMREGLGPCWLWTASVRKDGYGQFWFGNKNGTAHRGSYTLLVGPITDGLEVLHRCDVPLCVRPEHLFLGTNQDNMDDMREKGRGPYRDLTHCPRMHEYTPENTGLRRNGHRFCRTCKRESDRRQYARRRAA